MEDKTIYFMQSMKRTIGVGETFQSELSNNPALAAMFATLKDYESTAVDLSSKLYTTSKNATAESEALRDQSAQLLSIIASTASGYGKDANIMSLKELERFTFSSLRKSPSGLQIGQSKELFAVIEQHNVELKNCGIDDQMIDDAKKSIEKMETAAALPADIIDQHKNDKIMLDNHIDLCSKHLKKMDDAMEIYRVKNMAFYLAYTASRKLRHHHMKRKAKTGDAESSSGFLELLIIDKASSEPIAGAMLTIAALNIENESDADGETYNDMLPAGTYQAKISSDGYAEINFDFEIEAGKTCSKQFLMEKL